MTKIRILLFLLTIIIVGIGGYIALLYARGYRVNPDSGKITPHGLFVIKSSPNAAQLFINNELKTATDATLSLTPGSYQVEIKKEGYKTWSKNIQIKQEEVTEINASLFKSAPSLSALTFSGSINPVASPDLSKIVYAVRPANRADYTQKAGLWVIETINLPIGFSREPKRIADGDLSEASWMWSPDGREVLVTTNTGAYLFNAGTFTSQSQRINVATTKTTILSGWKEDEDKILQSKEKNLPEELKSILQTKAQSVLFSPDENMLLYTASGSATLPEDLIKHLPGSSTQTEDRKIETGKTYVYDIKEDKNFLVDTDSSNLVLGSQTDGAESKKIMWFPNSLNLVVSEKDKITIMDYDGTNPQVIFTGGFINPYVFTTVSADRLLILTDLGGNESANLYTLTIK